MQTLFVGNLSWNTQSEQLFSALSGLGNIDHAVVIFDHATARSKGFGFATFSTAEEAQRIAKQWDGVLDIDGRKLRLEMARTRRKVAPSSSSTGGGGGGAAAGGGGGSGSVGGGGGGGKSESVTGILPAPPPPLVSIETIEVVGEASDSDAAGDPPDDVAIAQILRDYDTPPTSEIDPGGKGHRYMNENGVLVTRYTRHRLQRAFMLMGLKQQRAHSMAVSVFDAVKANLNHERYMPMEFPKATPYSRSPSVSSTSHFVPPPAAISGKETAGISITINNNTNTTNTTTAAPAVACSSPSSPRSQQASSSFNNVAVGPSGSSSPPAAANNNANNANYEKAGSVKGDEKSTGGGSVKGGGGVPGRSGSVSSGGGRDDDRYERRGTVGAGAGESVIDLAQAHTIQYGFMIEATVRLSRRQFAALVRNALAKNHHRKAQHLRDFDIACDVNEHRKSFTVLLGGTSGCGKSTLASLLASRLGVTTVLSTDFVRHMLRKIYGRDKAPILWASTYNAGAALLEAAGGAAAGATTAASGTTNAAAAAGAVGGSTGAAAAAGGATTTTGTGTAITGSNASDELVLKGYHEQSNMLLEHLSSVMSSYEARRESLIIEGVHLSVENVVTLMKRHPTAIPFFVCITNEGKHRERFAVRAKYMTLDGRHNRYIKFFRNIRCIQSHLVQKAQEKLIPQIDNTNVDRSVTAVHDVLVKCLRKLHKGRHLYDENREQATVLHQLFSKRIKQSWSSKVMLDLIRTKISKGEVFQRFFEKPLPPIPSSFAAAAPPPPPPPATQVERGDSGGVGTDGAPTAAASVISNNNNNNNNNINDNNSNVANNQGGASFLSAGGDSPFVDIESNNNNLIISNTNNNNSTNNNNLSNFRDSLPPMDGSILDASHPDAANPSSNDSTQQQQQQQLQPLSSLSSDGTMQQQQLPLSANDGKGRRSSLPGGESQSEVVDSVSNGNVNNSNSDNNNNFNENENASNFQQNTSSSAALPLPSTMSPSLHPLAATNSPPPHSQHHSAARRQEFARRIVDFHDPALLVDAQEDEELKRPPSERAKDNDSDVDMAAFDLAPDALVRQIPPTTTIEDRSYIGSLGCFNQKEEEISEKGDDMDSDSDTTSQSAKSNISATEQLLQEEDGEIQSSMFNVKSSNAVDTEGLSSGDEHSRSASP